MQRYVGSLVCSSGSSLLDACPHNARDNASHASIYVKANGTIASDLYGTDDDYRLDASIVN